MERSTLRRRAGAVALFLLALYWLTASGAFHSIDEHAVFVVSRNIVLHGHLDQNALYWNAPYIDQAKIGLDGNVYSKYGLGHSLLITVPVALARLIPNAGLATSAMLLNSLATALTGGLLVFVAGELGYTERAGVVLGLLFGVATFAWVYAKTMFSEPLVALCWLAAVWLLLRNTRSRTLILAGIALAMSVTIRPISVLFVPLFAVPLWTDQPRDLVRRLLLLGLPVVVAGLGLLGFNLWRFGNPLDFGYSESFNGSLPTGLVGFLFSLDRSIFLFAPPLLLLFWSVPQFVRRHRRWGWTLLALVTATLVVHSAWPVFWGGPVWGPRYLLPVLPLAMILLTPAVAAALERNSWQRWTLGALIVAGTGMQVRGVVWNPLPATQTLGQRYPLWLLPPRTEWVDAAWMAAGRWDALLVAGGLLLLAGIALLRSRRNVLLSATALTVAGSILLTAWLGQVGLGFSTEPAYSSVMSQLGEHAREQDALIVNPTRYQDPIGQLLWFLNEPELDTPLYGVYREPPDDVGRMPARLQRLLNQHERIWLLTQSVVPGDPNSTTERLLADGAPRVTTQWLQDDYRLTTFDAPQPALVSDSPNVRLDDSIVLESWSVAPGTRSDTIQLTLRWRATADIDRQLHTFAQALDSSGQLRAGWDSAPQAGFAPTQMWAAGDTIEEHLALVVPPDVSGEQLEIIAGMYAPTTGERLRTPAGDDVVTLTALTWPLTEDNTDAD